MKVRLKRPEHLGGPLEIWIDPGDAPPSVVRELFAEFAARYAALCGVEDGLEVTPLDARAADLLRPDRN